MGVIADWRAARDRRQRATAFLDLLTHSAHSQSLGWLEGRSVDPHRARLELTDAVRAIGVIVAERDSLDDRTAADVAHVVNARASREARGAGDIGNRWSERWRSYSSSVSARGDGSPPAARIARVLLDGAGVSEPSAAELADATRWVQEVRGQANEALRTAFGAASLPEDLPPSSIRP